MHIQTAEQVLRYIRLSPCEGHPGLSQALAEESRVDGNKVRPCGCLGQVRHLYDRQRRRAERCADLRGDRREQVMEPIEFGGSQLERSRRGRRARGNVKDLLQLLR